MNATSVPEIERLKATIAKVDHEISRRRTAIKRNMVRNAGIATRELQAIERQNDQRKAYLHVNRGQIEAIYSKSSQHSKMRTSFNTPDGPKEKGNRGKPTKTILQIRKERATKQPPSFKPTPKSIKRQMAPPKSISINPPMKIISKPVNPVLPITKVTDAIRQKTHVIAKQKSEVVKKIKDAQRDAELVKQGKADLVATRRASEAAVKTKEVQKKVRTQRRAAINEIKQRANSAVSNAKRVASKRATKKLSKSRFTRRQFRPSGRGSRGSGLVPQLALMTAFSDKRRAATVNQAVRTPDKVIPGPIKDQITEDVRQFKPVKPTRSKEYFDIVKEVQTAEKEAHKMIQNALAGREVMGFKIDLKVLGQERVKYWVSRAYALMAQVKKVVLNEAIRWDEGSLNSGVAISTDNRSQSKRRMTRDEFNHYLTRKLQPIIEPVFNEFMEEGQRAQTAYNERSRPVVHKRALDNSLPFNRQKSLATADRLRGHGRPVLSEQRGTKGLAGLFPALRSSMQGALKR